MAPATTVSERREQQELLAYEFQQNLKYIDSLETITEVEEEGPTEDPYYDPEIDRKDDAYWDNRPLNGTIDWEEENGLDSQWDHFPRPKYGNPMEEMVVVAPRLKPGNIDIVWTPNPWQPPPARPPEITRPGKVVSPNPDNPWEEPDLTPPVQPQPEPQPPPQLPPGVTPIVPVVPEPPFDPGPAPGDQPDPEPPDTPERPPNEIPQRPPRPIRPPAPLPPPIGDPPPATDKPEEPIRDKPPQTNRPPVPVRPPQDNPGNDPNTDVDGEIIIEVIPPGRIRFRTGRPRGNKKGDEENTRRKDRKKQDARAYRAALRIINLTLGAATEVKDLIQVAENNIRINGRTLGSMSPWEKAEVLRQIVNGNIPAERFDVDFEQMLVDIHYMQTMDRTIGRMGALAGEAIAEMGIYGGIKAPSYATPL